MNKEEKEAFKYLDMMENKINFDLLGYVYGNEAIDTILNLVQKQSKIIDKMATEKDIKEYFEKVVDENVKD